MSEKTLKEWKDLSEATFCSHAASACPPCDQLLSFPFLFSPVCDPSLFWVLIFPPAVFLSSSSTVNCVSDVFIWSKSAERRPPDGCSSDKQKAVSYLCWWSAVICEARTNGEKHLKCFCDGLHSLNLPLVAQTFIRDGYILKTVVYLVIDRKVMAHEGHLDKKCRHRQQMNISGFTENVRWSFLLSSTGCERFFFLQPLYYPRLVNIGSWVI